MKLDIIFVSPKHGFPMNLVSGLVTGVCGSRWAHVAGVIEGGIFEAVFPEVMVSPIDKYNGCETIEIITIDVTDEQYGAVVKEARRIINRDVKYGILDGVVTGLATLFSYRVFKWLKFMYKENTMHCSGTWAHLLRTAGIKVLPGCDTAQISPQDLYSFLKLYQGGSK